MMIPTISIDLAMPTVSGVPDTTSTLLSMPEVGVLASQSTAPSPEVVQLFEKAMADNVVIAKEFETVVAEKPVILAAKPTFTEAFLAAESTKVAEFVKPEVPKAFESSVNYVAKELPVATPETFKAVVVENKEVAKVFEAVVTEKPVVVIEKPVIVQKHVIETTERPVVQAEAPVLATENTKITEATVVEKPQVVVTEMPKASEPSVNYVAKELPVATPETFKAVVVENKEVAKAFESVVTEKPVVVSEKSVVVSDQPAVIEKPIITDKSVVVAEKTVVVTEAPKATESSVNFVAKELPVATLETFKAVVAENKEVAETFEAVISEKQVVVATEKPVVQIQAPVFATENTKVSEKPVVSDRAQDTVIVKPEATIVEKTVVSEKPAVVVSETPKTNEPSVNYLAKELPVATPETFKAVVVENKEVAKVFETVVAEKPVVIREKPVIVEKPMAATIEKPVVSDGAQNVVIAKPEALPVATPETFKAVVVENKEVAKVFESVVIEKSVVVSVEKPVVHIPVLATGNTKVTEATVVEKPQVVVTEMPKASDPSVNYVAKELPVATPESFKAVVVENKEIAKVFETVISEKPVLVSEKPVVHVPVLATENTKITEATVVEKPVIAEKPIVTEKPIVAAKPKTVETSVNKEAPMPVVIDLTQLQPTAAPVKEVEVAPVAQVSASVVEQVERVSAASVLIEAATAVADTLVFNPGLVRGEGEIKVVLKENVLAGTEISMTIHNGELAIKFLPTVDAIATLLTNCQGELVQLLSPHVRNFKVTTSVVKKNDDETV